MVWHNPVASCCLELRERQAQWTSISLIGQHTPSVHKSFDDLLISTLCSSYDQKPEIKIGQTFVTLGLFFIGTARLI
jgi:hypothetical protein